jgi:hypothetical protein
MYVMMDGTWSRSYWMNFRCQFSPPFVYADVRKLRYIISLHRCAARNFSARAGDRLVWYNGD